LLSLLITVLVVAGCIYFYMVVRLPNVDVLKDMRLQVPLRIYSADAQLIGEYGAMRRNQVALDQVPKPLLQGIIATEDQRYFEHSGVDFIGIIRAARELAVTGQRNQGASTITMQVARNFFLTPEKTFSRKINEILLALKINSSFSKEKILELYVNRIYLGQHAYGVSAAAEIYYGKKLNELTLAEMAMIAGLPQAPSKENPITNPRAAKIRRDHVLDRMLEMKYINQPAYAQAIQAPAKAYYHGPETTVYAPHMAEMVRNVIYQQFGEEGYTNGLKVYTTLNAKLQEQANAALRDGLMDYEKRHGGLRKPTQNLGKPPANTSGWQDILATIPIENGLQPAAVTQVAQNSIRALLTNGLIITLPVDGSGWSRRTFKLGDVIRVVLKDNGKWALGQVPTIEGAIVVLDPDSGAVLALNGGFKGAENGFNRATQANRQPGSAFKPFIYAAALARGYNLATIINDAPIAINDTGDPNNLWRPQNDEKEFYGPTRMRMGLVRSINVMTIRLLQMVGIPFTLDYLARFGFDPATLPHGLSLALGTASVTPIQIAAAYAVFANGGYRVTPYFIQTIQAENGKVIYKANPPLAPLEQSELPNHVAQTVARELDPNARTAPRVIEADVAYLITNVLQDVIKRGTGRAAAVLNRNDLSGKTGTNQQYDAWFSGFNRRIVTTVWVGFDQQRPLYEHGSQAALPIWIDFMRGALAGMPEQSLYPPNDIVSAKIDPDTGLLADPYQDNAIFELFKQGTVPQQDSGEGSENGYGDDGSDGGDGSGVGENYYNSDENSGAQLF
jgi:penicillin-binding protein 1A